MTPRMHWPAAPGSTDFGEATAAQRAGRCNGINLRRLMTLVIIVEMEKINMRQIKRALRRSIDAKLAVLFETTAPGDRDADRWKEQLIDAQDALRRRPRSRRKPSRARKQAQP